MLRFFRKRDRSLRELNEDEAYARVHGDRQDVKIVHLPPRRKRYELDVTGETLRRGFEQRIDGRDPQSQPRPAPSGSEDASAEGPAADG